MDEPKVVSPAEAVPKSAHQRVRLNRSKHGCLVCRQKRIKCSESKPVCAQCSTGQRVCMWPNGVRTEKVRSLQPRVDSDRPIAIRPAPSAQKQSGSSASSTPAKKVSPVTTRSEFPPADSDNHVSRPAPAQPAVPGLHPFSSSSSDGQTHRKDTSNSGGDSAANRSERPPPPRLAAMNSSSSSTGGQAANSQSALPATKLNHESDNDEQSATSRPFGFQPVALSITSDSLFSAHLGAFLAPAIPEDALVVPPAVSLNQYCVASSSSVSSPMAFIRNTYLAKYTSGPFSTADLNFGLMVTPMMDEMDPNCQMNLRDPMRLQNILSNCVFQEAYIYSLRSTIGSPIHLVRTWISSLFLLAMSLELGLTSMSLRHLSHAVSCFKAPDIRTIIKTTSPNDPHRHLISFLSESVFRMSSMISLLIGDRPAILIEELPDLISNKPLNRIMRTTAFLRVQAFDILHAFVVAHDNHSRETVSAMIDKIALEITHCQALLNDLTRDVSIQDSSSRMTPFEFKSFSSLECAHASMALIFIKLLLVNIIERHNRSLVLRQYFAMLGSILLGPRQQPGTLDLLMVIMAGSMLEAVEERTWLLDSLRTGARNGHDLLMPVETVDAMMRHVWAGIDSRGRVTAIEDYLLRDFDGIRDIQNSMRHFMRGVGS